MALDKLEFIVSPPKSPIESLDASVWDSVVDRLGLKLPQQLRQFCVTYGSGAIVGDETTYLCILNPFSPTYFQTIEFECQRLRDAKHSGGEDAVPFGIYPEMGGLLPLGSDDCGTRLCWKTETITATWPVVVLWDWGLTGFRETQQSLLNFLVRLLSREIEFDCWPAPWFADKLRFRSFSMP